MSASSNTSAHRRWALAIPALLAASVIALIAGCGPGTATPDTATARPPAADARAIPASPIPTTPSPLAAPVEVWSSQPVVLPGGEPVTDQPVLTAIRTGAHDTHERLVFEFSAPFGEVSVRYVPTVRVDPSDQVLALAGHAYLRVVVHDAVATWNAVQHPPYPGPFTVTPDLPTLKQVRLAGDYEAVLSFGVGLDRISGLRVQRLSGPDRLVIDIAEPA